MQLQYLAKVINYLLNSPKGNSFSVDKGNCSIPGGICFKTNKNEIVDSGETSQPLDFEWELSKYYDQIRILSPDDFDKDMQEIYQEILTTRSNRGYGYWFWKPFFLKKIMNEINEGDIVHYLDIGCHIQNKNNRFYDYLDLIFDNEKWIVTFHSSFFFLHLCSNLRNNY